MRRACSGRSSGRIALALALPALVVAGGVVLSATGLAPWRRAVITADPDGARVQRGPLRICVTARGNLNAAETVRLTCGIEGRTTILSIAPQGTQVREGDVVCELDATAMVEKRIQQAITAGNAEAACVQARQTLEIQQSQNGSDIRKARQAIEFAGQDLQMFLEGERRVELEQAEQTLDLAREDAERARNRLAWSEKLTGKGFLTASELEADRIAMHRAEVTEVQAKRSLELLQNFRHPRRESELRAALEEAKQEGQRVELQAKARLIDFESNVRTDQATLALEQQKLTRLDTQIEMAKIRAPRNGYVVYAQRDSDEPPIQAGAEVREREEILSIPSSEGMTAELKLHESVLKQVEVGQECVVTIEALPGVVLAGRMSFVAMLPDQNTRWMNPNLRMYRADVAITTAHAGLRPGMSCAVEIRIEELADATFVPVQAVFRDARGTACFVSADGDAERREVRVGKYNDLWVQILEGVQAGEIVRMSAPPGLEVRTIAPEPGAAEASAGG